MSTFSPYPQQSPADPMLEFYIDDLTAFLASTDLDDEDLTSSPLSVKRYHSIYIPDTASDMTATDNPWKDQIPIFHSGPRDAPLFAAPNFKPYNNLMKRTHLDSEADALPISEFAVVDSDDEDATSEPPPLAIPPSEHPYLRCTFTTVPPLPSPGTLWLIHSIGAQRTDPCTGMRFYLCIGRELRPLFNGAGCPDRYARAVYVFPSSGAPEGAEMCREKGLLVRWMPEPWVPQTRIGEWLMWKVDNLSEGIMDFQDDLLDDEEMEKEHEILIERAKRKALEEWQRELLEESEINQLGREMERVA